jgi:hypothetical protein
MRDGERIWHEIFDPALEFCDVFIQTLTTTPPPAIPLLTLIRLNDQIIELAEIRGTVPLLQFLQKQKLALWPLYRRDIDRRIDEVKRLCTEAEAKGWLAGKGVKDAVVRQMATRYAALFSCTVALSADTDEMIFSR